MIHKTLDVMESQAQSNILSADTNLLIFTDTLKFFPKDKDANWRTNSKKWGCNGTTSQRPIFSELEIHETVWCSTLYSTTLQPYAVTKI